MGEKPDGIVRLPIETINARYSSRDRLPQTELVKSLSDPHQREYILQRLSTETGAYIRQRRSSDRFLDIWGETTQVDSARAILFTLIDKVVQGRTEGPRGWGKIHPINGEDEEEAMLEAAIKEGLASLRLRPNNWIFESERVFYWPRDGPTVHEGLGKRLEKLDPIREEFHAHIYLEEGSAEKICISGSRDTDMEQIITQLEGLLNEAEAKVDAGVKTYMFEPFVMDVDTVPDKVVFVKSDGRALPFFSEAHQSISDTKKSLQSGDLNLILKENYQRILKSFRAALLKTDLFPGQLRMRVHFGSFVMDRYREPKGGKGVYSLEEFREMILQDRSRGKLLPGGEELLSRCMDAVTLFKPVDASFALSEIKSIIPTYAASFEFLGRTSSKFRLEVDFRRRSTEIEKSYHRWFHTANRNSEGLRRLLLQVSVMNLSQSDWQGDLEFFEPLHDSQVKEELAPFMRSVRFDNNLRVHGMATESCKKVLFDQSDLVSSFIEKSAVRLIVQGTNYVLELARFDQYTRIRTGWTTTPAVSWGASLFDPSWDVTLGGSSIKANPTAPRNTAGHVRSFESFFPPTSTSTTGDEGFKEYMKIVNNISRLLGLGKDEFEKLSKDSIKTKIVELMDVELGMLF
ncbi:hypothetical protein N7454_003300 [Penicillium verhagenii]|nr:hypothetical protein N7454_003300 [Penicillium verhagenii]